MKADPSALPFAIAEAVADRRHFIIKAYQPACRRFGRNRRERKHVTADHVLLSVRQRRIASLGVSERRDGMTKPMKAVRGSLFFAIVQIKIVQ